MDREMQERMRLDWPTGRTIDALESIAAELERLRVLKEHELGVRLEYGGGSGPYVPKDSEQE
jgi:hypothetical protein